MYSGPTPITARLEPGSRIGPYEPVAAVALVILAAYVLGRHM